MSGIEQIMPGFWRIPVPLPGNPLKELNSYLIRGQDENLLIDTGFRIEPCRAAITEALTELGVRREETDILLTHLHSDHSGLAPELVGPERRIYVGRVDLPYLANSAVWKKDFGPRFLKMGFSEAEVGRRQTENPAQSMAPGDCDRYFPLDEEETITCGPYTLRAIFTPGHTPGHLCFAMDEERILLTGDHVLFDITPNIATWRELPDALGSYLDSLEKMEAFAAYRALPGHRGGGDLARRTAELKEHHAERLTEALDAVRTAPGRTAYELAGRIRWKIRARNWEEFPLAQKWFAVGECQAHLDRLMVLGKVDRLWDGAVWRYQTAEGGCAPETEMIRS